MAETLDWMLIDRIIDFALEEDLSTIGDLTSIYTIPEKMNGTGEFLAKEKGIVCGLPIVERIFHQVNPDLNVKFEVRDGQSIKENNAFGTVTGSFRSMLIAERTSLNFLQRLSGIATMTHKYVKQVKKTKTRILDTRKTTPMFRYLEKYAVRTGGGTNHRYGLYDMILIKDNHIRGAGSISEAIERCLKQIADQNTVVQIEVEAGTLEDVHEAMQYPIHRIMLDNMDVEMMEEAVRMVGNQIELEASGNINGDNIKRVAATGVQYISVGALTHSVRSLDISFNIKIQT